MSKLKELLACWPITLGVVMAVLVVCVLAISSARGKPISAQYTPVILHQAVVARGATMEHGEGVFKTTPGALVVPPSMWHVPVEPANE